MTFSTGPRGEAVWPDWRTAPAGTRVRHTGSGWTGTVVSHGARHLTIRWDQSGATGRVVAPAYDLSPIRDAVQDEQATCYDLTYNQSHGADTAPQIEQSNEVRTMTQSMLGTPNRVLDYAAKVQAIIDTGLKPDGSPVGDLAALERELALTPGEVFAYQNAKSRAQLMGLITVDEAMTIYAAIGEGGDWAQGTSLALKVTITNLMGELIKAARS